MSQPPGNHLEIIRDQLTADYLAAKPRHELGEAIAALVLAFTPRP
jgi:hypothetical protein